MNKELIEQIKLGMLKNADIANQIEAQNISLNDINFLDDQQLEDIQDILQSREQKAFAEAKKGSPINLQACHAFVQKYPQSKHVDAILKLIEKADDEAWNAATANTDADTLQTALQQYLQNFPDGKHKNDVQNFDIAWISATNTGTLEAYQAYLTNNPFGAHVQECQQQITNFSDEPDWNIAKKSKTLEGLQEYLKKHPFGKYAGDAQQKIEKYSKQQSIIEALRADKNAYSAKELQKMLYHKEIDLEFLKASNVFQPHQLEAIRNYSGQIASAPDSIFDELKGSTTEVYFWGFPKSGKTCVMAALLAYLHNNGKYRAKMSKNAKYRDALISAFAQPYGNFFPASTSVDAFYSIIFDLHSGKKGDKPRPTAMMDVSGESFKQMYNKVNGMPVVNPDSLSLLQKHLTAEKNYNMHFFIWPYGEENDKDTEGIDKAVLFDTFLDYIEKMNIFRNTVSVNIIVTKADKINGNDYQAEAYRYVKEGRLRSFYTGLSQLVKHNGLYVGIIPFTVGDCYAQSLFDFDNHNPHIQTLYEVFLKGALPQSSGCLSKILKIFNS